MRNARCGVRKHGRRKAKFSKVVGEWTGPRYFKVYSLSQRAQRIIRDRVQHHWSTPQILRELKKRTRERIALRSLQSFCAHERQELKAREQAADQMTAITQAALKMGHKLTAAVQAELLALLFHAARRKQLGPYQAGKLAVDLAASRRKDRELNLHGELGRRNVKVKEGKLRLDAQKGKKARPSSRAEKDPGASPADAIREIFGISNEKEKK